MRRRLARLVLKAARERGVMVATAESCTGGMVAAALTDIAGSSDVVDRGFVTYSNAAKQQLLGVPEALIAAHGAVSEPVVRAMAEGALARSDAGITVAITGIAGPGGGSEEKPVGLVWFAVAVRGAGTRAVEHRFGDITRGGVRDEATDAALKMLLEDLAPGLSDEDEWNPLIERGAQPPGRWVDAPPESGIPGGSRIWEGLSSWRTRHGASTLHWSLGEPFQAVDALLPDGSRGRVTAYTHSDLWRRWSKDSGEYVQGVVEISDEDVVFRDTGKYRESVASDPLTMALYEAIAADPDLVSVARTPEGGRALFVVLAWDDLVQESTGEHPYLGLSRASGIVARVRDIGESFVDFKAQPWGREERPSEAVISEVRRHLERLGWKG